jgi:hypothetical protein
MKLFLFFFLSIITAVCCFSNSADAEGRISTSRYQTLHIKQMAHRNFSNHGRTGYVYEEQQYSLYGSKSISIGTVQLEKNSRIREMYIAVDMKRSQRIQRLSQKRKISIGRVSGDVSRLKSLNVFVNSNGNMHY